MRTRRLIRGRIASRREDPRITTRLCLVLLPVTQLFESVAVPLSRSKRLPVPVPVWHRARLSLMGLKANVGALALLGLLASGAHAQRACERHGDCLVNQFCGPSSCRPCSSVTPSSCSTFDGAHCCNTTFINSCPTNPHGCTRRRDPTGAHMAAGQPAVDFAIEYGVPLLRDALLGMDPKDFVDKSFGSLRGSLLGVTVTDVQFSQVSATLLTNARVRLDVVGMALEARALAVRAVQPMIWPLPDITCTGVSRTTIPSRPTGEYGGWLSLPWSANTDSPFPSTWWSGSIRSSSSSNRLSLTIGLG